MSDYTHITPGPPDDKWLSGSLGNRLFRISLPLIFNQGAVILMLFCDRLFLSWYGTNEISAVWPATFLYLACMTVFYAVTSFVNIFLAQYYGAGRKKMCSAVIWQGIYLALLGWLILLAVIPAGRQVFGLFGHRPEIAALERTYFSTLMLFSIMPLMNNVLAAFFTGRGRTVVTMSANVAGNALNIFLDWVLIFGHFGMPRLGILGAALATGISSAVPPLIMLAIFLHRRFQEEYETRIQRRFRPRLFKLFFHYGLPSASHDLTYYIAVALFFMFMGRTLPESLAANNIAWSVNELLTLYIHGLCLANMTMFAQAVGAGRKHESERVAYLVIKILLIGAAVVGLVYLFLPGAIFDFFRPRAGEGAEDVPFSLVKDRGRWILLLMICYNFCLAFVYSFRQALRGAGDTNYFIRVSLFIDVLFFVPGIFLATHFFGADYLVLWSFFIVYLAILAVAHFRRFRGGHWMTIERHELYEEL